ncbi:MAG: hypothetical protein JSV96_18305 [Candidatus Aminicenantes bacterium]|nr:MAG: hypothetical protein JSV96_18305 [Candidatus Aminicenantes bacterium]
MNQAPANIGKNCYKISMTTLGLNEFLSVLKTEKNKQRRDHLSHDKIKPVAAGKNLSQQVFQNEYAQDLTSYTGTFPFCQF